MNITKYVSDKINDCPEYYPHEWFTGCELLLKQINNGLAVDTAEKNALTEYSEILRATAKVSAFCKAFDEKEQREIKQEAEKLDRVIAEILATNR